jgi:hypothetical protein
MTHEEFMNETPQRMRWTRGKYRKEKNMSGPDEDNHSDQLNPNNDAYWDSRGEDGRPDDWEERSQ